MAKNPFVIGRVASGNSFIGRKGLLAKYRNDVFGSGSRPCISIVGVTKSGKTSFVRKLLKTKSHNSITIDIALGTLKKFKDLWIEIAKQCIKKLHADNIECEDLEEDLQSLSVNDNFLIVKSSIESFFLNVVSKNKKLVIAIDEFDKAPNVFKDESAAFEICREIFSNERYKITAIVISRRNLSTIVAETYQTSTFEGIFYTKYFKGFDSADLDDYWKIFKKKNILLSDNQKEQITYYAGNSPYLLSIMGYNIINRVNQGEAINIDDIFLNDCKDIHKYYSDIIQHLERDHAKEKLLALVAGPPFKVTKRDKSDLINLGYLNDDKNQDDRSPLVSFSKYFTELLINEEAVNNPIWPELIGTEKLLKRIVRKELKNIFDYTKATNQEQLIMVICNKQEEVDALKRFKNSSKTNFHRNNVDYIDVISLKQTFAIVRKCWGPVFSKYFGNDDIKEWRFKFDMCGNARNPIAHGHEDYLSNTTCNQVTSYCREIQESINKHLL